MSELDGRDTIEHYLSTYQKRQKYQKASAIITLPVTCAETT
nr:hypothetical protein [Bacillus weihaiensis]